MFWSPTNLSRQAYFKNSAESKIIYGSNEWSLSDYRRRVSSTATVEASYEHRSSRSSTNLFGAPHAWMHPVVSDLVRSNILGLAAGGQMCCARDLKLLIVSLIS